MATFFAEKYGIRYEEAQAIAKLGHEVVFVSNVDAIRSIGPCKSLREWLIGMALQGILAGNSFPSLKHPSEIEGLNPDECVSMMAIEIADAVIARLEKENKHE